MPRTVKEDFTFHKGRTFSQDFSVINFKGKIDNILFTACENPENKHYCLRKSLGDGITLVDEGTDEDGNNYKTYNLLIEATDTDHLKSKVKYGYDIAMYSNKQKHQLMEGTLTLSSIQTKTCNEC